MPRGIYKRKKKASRPKGRKNKKPNLRQYVEQFGISNAKIGETLRIRLPDDYKVEDRNKLHIPTEPPSYLSRLEAATVKYEQAISDAIIALKGQ